MMDSQTPDTSGPTDFSLGGGSDIQIIPTLSGYCYDNDMEIDDNPSAEKVLAGFEDLGLEIHEAENFFADGYAPTITKKTPS